VIKKELWPKAPTQLLIKRRQLPHPVHTHKEQNDEALKRGIKLTFHAIFAASVLDQKTTRKDQGGGAPVEMIDRRNSSCL